MFESKTIRNVFFKSLSANLVVKLIIILLHSFFFKRSTLHKISSNSYKRPVEQSLLEETVMKANIIHHLFFFFVLAFPCVVALRQKCIVSLSYYTKQYKAHRATFDDHT